MRSYFILGKHQLGLRRALFLTLIFFTGVLAIGLHRYYTFYTSYDQGLFNQLFWNTLRGNWFQSSLTSANSVASLEDGRIPIVSFLHLGQHFVLDFLLWMPLYALFPHPVTLIVLQAVLMTLGGVVLYALARHYLSSQLSLWIVGSYYGAIAVISPTFANFYEQCQIPLFTFGCLLALEKQRWAWFWLCVLLVLGLREDAGIILFGIGVYLILSRRHPWAGLAVCLVSFGYMAFVTNVIMPRISEDTSRLYLAHRFGQFVDTPNPTTMQVLWGMVTKPIALLSSLFLPLDRSLSYLAAHALPLAFVPAFSASAWTIAGFPLLALLLQSGKSALAINLRYALAVVPGVFYGAILWWSHHPNAFKPRLRRFWAVCIALSLVFTVINNPNRSLSFMIPDSIRPWVFVPITRQWEHANQIRQVIRNIPDGVSVSTTTYLIPQLSSRRVIIRLPRLQIWDDRGQLITVDYTVADLWQMQEYQKAFADSADALRATLPLLEKVSADGTYGVLQVQDGVVLMQKGASSNPEALAAWRSLKAEIKQKFQFQSSARLDPNVDKLARNQT